MWKAIARVLFWTYERGSLPYDIACALILAFIFLTPPQIFDGTFFTDRPASEPSASQPVQESPDEGPDPKHQTGRNDDQESAPSKYTE